MSMISEQVKELRYKADIYNTVGSAWELNQAEAKILQGLLRKAANTIEFLSAKLQVANMERSEDCGGGWISCKDRLPENDGIYWAIVTLPKPVENGYSFMDTEQWYDSHTLEELCEWEKNAPKHTGLAKFENGDWKTSTKRRFTKILAWQPIVEPEPYHEP